ncbi:MAG: DUF2804 domain-containing protein [Sphaerochaetaceae bacterium]
MDQNLVTKRQNLLDKSGFVTEQGYSPKPVWFYNKERHRCSALKIKEWDRYLIFDYKNEIVITANYSHLGYLSYFAITYINLKESSLSYIGTKRPSRFTKIDLPLHSDDYSIGWANKRLRIAFSKRDSKRRLLLGAPSLEISGHENRGLIADFTLTQDPQSETFNLVTGSSQKKSSYSLSEKVVPLQVSGLLTLGMDEIEIEPNTTRAFLYWQRGRWRTKTPLYWAGSTGFIEDKELSFSFGLGLGDTSATENCLIYDKKLHKLDTIEFIKGTKWVIKENKGRVDLTFEPKVSHTVYKNLRVSKSEQTQLFGHFNGTVKVENKTVTLKNFIGFIDTIYKRN